MYGTILQEDGNQPIPNIRYNVLFKAMPTDSISNQDIDGMVLFVETVLKILTCSR